MRANDFFSVIKALFDLLMNNQIMGLPLLVWFLITLVFAIIISFVKGGKNEKN